MGLDWRPLGKPRPGFENRYSELFTIIRTEEIQVGGNREELLDEWFAIQTPCYELLKAPIVGKDAAANEWLKEKYEYRDDKSISLEEFLNQHAGYYVIDLAEESDGVPVYISPVGDRNGFRAQFLQDCGDIIGDDLLNQAWESKLANDALSYADQLMTIADEYATKHNLLYLKEQVSPPDVDTLESKIHILYAAAKWLNFYARNGHGYEADF